MTDMADPDTIIAPAPAASRRPLARRTKPARNTESLRGALDRVVGDLGLPAEAGGTAASLELGVTLKRARLAKGMTQKDLVDRTGVSQAALSMIENGLGPDGPTWTTISRICEALELEPSFLPLEAGDAARQTPDEPEVRIFRPSTSLKAKVREVGLDEAAMTLAWGLLSAEAMKWIRTALRKAMVGTVKPADAFAARPRFLSLAPHAGTRIKADAPLVVIALDGSRVGVRAVTMPGAGKTLVHDGVALVGKKGAVEVGNMSDASSLVFALPAARLLENGEAMSS